MNIWLEILVRHGVAQGLNIKEQDFSLFLSLALSLSIEESAAAYIRISSGLPSLYRGKSSAYLSRWSKLLCTPNSILRVNYWHTYVHRWCVLQWSDRRYFSLVCICVRQLVMGASKFSRSNIPRDFFIHNPRYVFVENNCELFFFINWCCIHWERIGS